MSAQRRPRTGATSGTVVPMDRSPTCHLYGVDDERVRAEVVDEVWAAGRPLVATAMMLGEVWARVRAAARHELVDSDRMSPVRSRPELWELRWSFPRAGEFRMYHAEPPGGPDLVALAFHHKKIDGVSGKRIKAEQQGHIDRAAARFRSGEPARWGHTPRRCVECLDMSDEHDK